MCQQCFTEYGIIFLKRVDFCEIYYSRKETERLKRKWTHVHCGLPSVPWSRSFCYVCANCK